MIAWSGTQYSSFFRIGRLMSNRITILVSTNISSRYGQIMFANTFIGICWAIVVIVWIITGANSEKTKLPPRSRAGKWFRLFLLIALASCFLIDDLKILNTIFLFPPDLYIQWLSVALCFVGLSFAIWARFEMGDKWAMPMVQNENTDLVTSGPYRLVRHPIYSGLCLAMTGSMLTASVLWCMWYGLWTMYFVYSAFMEERSIARQFPVDYPRYRKRTRMLIPYLF